MTPLRALLFDMDGTLADTDPLHCRAFVEALVPYGIVMRESDYRTQFSGQPNDDIALAVFPDAPVERRRAFVRAKEALFRSMIADVPLLPGLAELLAWADARRLGTALVTNAPRDNIDHVLGCLGLTTRFDTIVVGDELARPKPDPLPYATAMQRLGVTAGAAVAFEDSLPGVRSAAGAGVRTVGIATAQPPERLMEAGAVLVIDDFRDPRLAALLEG